MSRRFLEILDFRFENLDLRLLGPPERRQSGKLLGGFDFFCANWDLFAYLCI